MRPTVGRSATSGQYGEHADLHPPAEHRRQATGRDSAAGVTEAAAAVLAVKRIGLDEAARRDRQHNQLRYPITTTNLVGPRRIGVDEHDPQLFPITTVDEPRAVQHRDTVAKRQPAARLHEPRMALGDGQRETRRDERTTAGWQQERVMTRQQIKTGITHARIRRRRKIAVEPDDGQIHEVHDETLGRDPRALKHTSRRPERPTGHSRLRHGGQNARPGPKKQTTLVQSVTRCQRATWRR